MANIMTTGNMVGPFKNLNTGIQNWGMEVQDGIKRF